MTITQARQFLAQRRRDQSIGRVTEIPKHFKKGLQRVAASTIVMIVIVVLISHFGQISMPKALKPFADLIGWGIAGFALLPIGISFAIRTKAVWPLLGSAAIIAGATGLAQCLFQRGGRIGAEVATMLNMPTDISALGFTILILSGSMLIGDPFGSIFGKAADIVSEPFFLPEPAEAPAQSDVRDSKVERLQDLLIARKIEGPRVEDITIGYRTEAYHVAIPIEFDLKKLINQREDLKLHMGIEQMSIAPSKKAGRVDIITPRPTADCESLPLMDVLNSEAFQSAEGALKIPLGADIQRKIITRDLAKMPHLLVAGTTGGGKSVALNAIIISLMHQLPPSALQLVLIDPKILELSIFENSPYLRQPIITDMADAGPTLESLIEEMERRYKLLAAAKTRNIAEFNSGRTADKRLPYIVTVIDEFADLMETHKKESEDKVKRLGAKARAAGINLIITTQRPSADVITGVIKSNVPGRLALRTSDDINSRIIIDTRDAADLVDAGDAIYTGPGERSLVRIQTPFISTDEVVKFLKEHRHA